MWGDDCWEKDYTLRHDVEEGRLDFRALALRCARKFQPALLRDPSAFDPHPRPTADSLVAGALERRLRYEEERRSLLAMTPEEADAQVEADYQKKLAWRRDHEEEKRQKRERHERLLAQVLAWVPPTPEHGELRLYMEQQVREALRHVQPDPTWDVIDRPTGTEWRAERLLTAEHMIRSSSTDEIEAIRKGERDEAWVMALLASIPPEAV
jgi:hypothetical protein